MARTLIVPGVSVEARFDVPPPLPARSGILGAVGVVDRLAGSGPVGVTTTQQLFDLLGPATRFSFAEAVSALVNGVSEVILSPVAPGSGSAASLVLADEENQDVVELRARAVGPWGNQLAARVIRTLAQDRRTVRRLSLEILHKGRSVERHDNLVLRPGDPNDLFVVINRDSAVVTAVDPAFQLDLPALDADNRSFDDGPAQTAGLVLRSGATDLIRLSARAAGNGGNRISAETRAGRAALVLNAPGDVPAVRVFAARPGAEGEGIRITVAEEAGATLAVTVQPAGGDARSYPGLNGVAAVVAALNSDTDVRAERLGDVPPAARAATALAPTRTVTIRVEGQRTQDHADHASAEALVAALNSDPDVSAELLGAAAALPDVAAANSGYLAGGRDAGPRLRYRGRDNPGADILELRPADGVTAAPLRLRITNGSSAGTVRLTVSVEADGGLNVREVHDNLSPDPDNPRHLPSVLAVESGLVRAVPLHPTADQGITRWPNATFAPRPFAGGRMPGIAAWQSAIDALGNEDAVDLMIAGLQDWADDTLNGIAVQQAMIGHARAQADNAKPRIVIGSAPPAANRDPDALIAHRNEVTDRRFVLVAPSGTDGAMAGLLGHLNYFASPTFKTVAQPGAALVPYSESELNRLVGPDGNLCVIAQKKGRGTICIKGIATDGFQISVVRVADRCIREVNAISQRFIGELNNAEQRTALEQMIKATFTQMERDGSLVPSVDGKSPAFEVLVYASQNDAAAGIARIDIAVRPVRAIDYIYATIRVKN